LVEPAINTVAYYFHEKVWNKIGDASSLDMQVSQY